LLEINDKLQYTVSHPMIGGVRQAVLTLENDHKKPVLLLVHGGPGEPMTPFLEKLSGLEDRFVVCLWEQRGAGMSYTRLEKPEDLCISRFVSDAVEVTRFLLGRFGREQLVLMGFSWGSLVGILAASKAPELFSAYIGVGQIADQRASERSAFNAALARAQKAGDVKSADFLIRTGAPPYTGKGAMQRLMKERAILRKYSGSPAGKTKTADYVRKICACPYYTLSDKINYFRGMKYGLALFAEVMEARVLDLAPSLTVPVYVMQGKHDMQTRPECAQLLVERLSAPEKRFFLFEKAGHSPLEDEPEAFLRAIDSIDRLFDPKVVSA